MKNAVSSQDLYGYKGTAVPIVHYLTPHVLGPDTRNSTGAATKEPGSLIPAYLQSHSLLIPLFCTSKALICGTVWRSAWLPGGLLAVAHLGHSGLSLPAALTQEDKLLGSGVNTV